jgi:hypothetical protein
MSIPDIIFPLGTRFASVLGGGGVTTPAPAGENRKMYDTLGGSTAVFAAHPDALANHSAMRDNVLSAFCSISLPASITRVRIGFHVWIVTNAATAAFQMASALTAAASRHHIRQNTTTNVQANVAGGSVIDILTAPSLATMYWIEALFDCGSGTHTLDSWVNGVKQTQVTGAIAASTFTQVSVGNPNASGTCDMYVSDAVCNYTNPNDYIGETYVLDFVPSLYGTHVMTTGDFTNNSSANVVVGETASAALIDEWPANITDYVQQIVTRTTSYLEYKFAVAPPVGYPKPVGMRIDTAMMPVAAATANDVAFRLNDNLGAVVTAEASFDCSITSSTLEYHSNFYSKRPSTLGPWTLDALKDARLRFGFSADAAPPPALSAALMSVAFQQASDTPNMIDRPRWTRKLRR